MFRASSRPRDGTKCIHIQYDDTNRHSFPTTQEGHLQNRINARLSIMRVPKYSTETEGTSDNPSPRYPTMSGRMNDKKASAERDEESQFLLLHVDNATFSLWQEAQNLCAIALPSVAAQFNLYFLFPLSASFVGRYGGTADLAGYSLGSLTGNITCLSVVLGALGAADMLMVRNCFSLHLCFVYDLCILKHFACSCPSLSLYCCCLLFFELIVALSSTQTAPCCGGTGLSRVGPFGHTGCLCMRAVVAASHHATVFGIVDNSIAGVLGTRPHRS